MYEEDNTVTLAFATFVAVVTFQVLSTGDILGATLILAAAITGSLIGHYL